MQTTAQAKRPWTAYATALGGIAAAGASAPAGAAIVYTDIADITMSTVNDALYFDLDQSGAGPYAQLNGATPAGADFFIRGTGAIDVLSMVAFNNNQTAGYYLDKLSGSGTIDASQSWWGGGVSYFEFWNVGNWDDGGDGYIGLRLNAGGGNFNYGWIHIDYDDANNTLVLKDFAYQTTVNTSITAGDVGTVSSVPEPSTALMAAMGLGGLALRRRRLAAQQA